MRAYLIVAAAFVSVFALKSNEIEQGLVVNPTLMREHLANSKTAAGTAARMMQSKGPELVHAMASWVQNRGEIPTSLRQVSSELATVMGATSDGIDAGYIGLEIRAEVDASGLNPGVDDMMMFVIKGKKAKFCWGLAVGVEPQVLGTRKVEGTELEVMLIGGGARYDSFKSGGRGVPDYFNSSIVFVEFGAEVEVEVKALHEAPVRIDGTVGWALNEDSSPVFMAGAELGTKAYEFKDLEMITEYVDNKIPKLQEYKGKLTDMVHDKFPSLEKVGVSIEANVGGMWCTVEFPASEP